VKQVRNALKQFSLKSKNGLSSFSLMGQRGKVNSQECSTARRELRNKGVLNRPSNAPSNHKRAGDSGDKKAVPGTRKRRYNEREEGKTGGGECGIRNRTIRRKSSKKGIRPAIEKEDGRGNGRLSECKRTTVIQRKGEIRGLAVIRGS